jgi:molybdopterin/thiamine biosynthesis adenylyltransferase
MSSLDPASRVLLPAYLQVTGARLESPPSPCPRFSVRLGVFPGTPREQTLSLSDRAFFVLSIADGTRTLEECLDTVRVEFDDGVDCEPELQDLAGRGILVDARSNPAAMPQAADRFARHRLFYASVGESPATVQERLASSRVAIVGVGGVGTWLTFLLGAAGVGTLVLIDGDRIELSNLTRQLFFGTSDVGKHKVDAARDGVLRVNPDLRCIARARSVASPEDAAELIGDVDLIVLSGDRPSNITEIIDDYSLERGIPWSNAGYAHHVAVCGPLLVPGETGCRRCLLLATGRRASSLPLVSDIAARFQVPSFGPINGIAASMQAKEAIAWLGGMRPMVQSLDAVCTMDALSMQGSAVRVQHAPGCAHCRRSPERAA